MPTLLKIGFDYWIVDNPKNAAAVINAMAGAVQLKRDYDSPHVEKFYPDEHPDEIGMVTVRTDEILPHKPGKSSVEVEPARRQLSAGSSRGQIER